MIGDTMPEDGYDAGDPIQARLSVLVAVVEAIRDDPDDTRREARRRDALRVIALFCDEMTVTGSHLRMLIDELEELEADE